MSRISVQVNVGDKQLLVEGGYDRPFNHYFCSVQDINDPLDDEGEDKFLYHSMEDSEADWGGGFNNLNTLMKKVHATLGENIPGPFWKEVSIPRGNFGLRVSDVNI